MNFGYVYDHCPEYSYFSMEIVAIFPGFKIENQSFSFTVQISSEVRSRFVCGVIYLKFGGEILNS